MNNHRRLVAAAAIAPLTVPAVFMAIQVFVADNRSAMLLVGAFSTVSAYAGTLLIGLPMVCALRRVQLLSVFSVAGVGAIGGVVVLLAFLHLLGFLLKSSAPFEPIQALWGGVLGLLVSLAFCALAGITWRSNGRPNSGAV